MCGICGMIGTVDERSLRRMTQILHHRGPDEGGIWFSIEEGVGLGHRRLRVIDPRPAGRQPMFSADRRYLITYNGEIFNFRSLRKELECRGFLFKTGTDTEVLLAGYSFWGKDILSRIRGQFAFAIWDRVGRSLFAARDRFGIKPFYYWMNDESFLFASEIKALLASRIPVAELHSEKLSQQLSFLWVAHPESLFRNIYKLEPGHYLEYRAGVVQKTRYWDIQFKEDYLRSRADTELELRTRIESAVQSQLMSDVPVGLLLSGGIYSTCLLSSMVGRTDGITALTATYSFQDRRADLFADDLAFARLAAQQYRVAHEVLDLSSDIHSIIDSIVWHLDEPLGDPSVITNYLLCMHAKPSATVLLSGMGADELLAGYPRYPAVLRMEQFPLLFRIGRACTAPILSRLRGRHGKMGGLLRRLQILSENTGLPFEERFIGISSYIGKDNPIRREHPGPWDVTRNAYGTHERYFRNARAFTPLNQLLYVDLKTFLPCLNLENMDKTSMAHAVEMRVPFLDEDLVDFIGTIPEKMKLRGMQRKDILKKAYSGYVPDEIVRRSKTGFSVPIRKWVRIDLRDAIYDQLLSRAFLDIGICSKAVIEELIRRHETGVEDHSLTLWQLYIIAVWDSIYFHGSVYERYPDIDNLTAIDDDGT